MRILISTASYAPARNGQAVFTTNLAEGLASRGHQVMVVTDSLHPRASQRVENEVCIHELPAVSIGFLHTGVYFSPFPVREVRRVFDDYQPEIVHIQDHYPSCRAVIHAAVGRRIKVIATNHFIPENLSPYIPVLSRIKPVFNWILWQWMLDTYRHADVVSAQSMAASEILKQQGLRKPIIPVSCGIDIKRFHPDPDTDRAEYLSRYGISKEKKIFLFLGRIDGEKRVEVLLSAMQQVTRDDVQLAIAGHGSVETTLRRRALAMNLGDRVRFTGFIPEEDLPGLLNSVDVFVMPSEAELLSISTLEAMACARPVLLADALALPELVKDGLNGYLFKPGDVGELVQRMEAMADHPETWKMMGDESRKIAIQHSLIETVLKFESLYRKLAGVTATAELKKRVKETA